MNTHISQAGSVLIDYLVARGFWTTGDRFGGRPRERDSLNRGHA
jgi:hypothetical protein